MAISSAIPKTPAAIWSFRLALFSILLILTALVLHRFAGYPTGLLLNTLEFGFALAGAAVLLALTAIVIIWRKGRAGTVRAVFGLLLAAMVFAWPASLIPTLRELPMINDITTDLERPPQFHFAARGRGLGANSIQYPGSETARAQSQSYPYIAPILVNRSIQEAFELARETVKRLSWQIISMEPPRGRRASGGRIEATDKTIILGFIDDVVIRIVGNAQTARIDLRSASRFGRHDFGRNADRIESFRRTFKARLQATVSLAAERAAARANIRKKRRAKSTRARARAKSRRRPQRRRRSRNRE